MRISWYSKIFVSFFLKKDVNFQNAVLCTRQDFLADRCIAKVCCIVCGTMQKDIYIYIYKFFLLLFFYYYYLEVSLKLIFIMTGVWLRWVVKCSLTNSLFLGSCQLHTQDHISLDSNYNYQEYVKTTTKKDLNNWRRNHRIYWLRKQMWSYKHN